MKKNILLIFVFTVGLLGCSSNDMNNKNKTTPIPNTTAVINDVINKGTDNEVINPNGNTKPSEDGDSLSKTFIPNFENIKKIMGLNKEQVIDVLGDNYEIVPAGAEGLKEGYYYEEYGVTIVFDYFPIPDIVGYIKCNEKVDIKGAKLGMSIPEIKAILGEGKIKEPFPDHLMYIITYEFEDIIVWFGGAGGKDGVPTALEIRRNRMRDDV